MKRFLAIILLLFLFLAGCQSQANQLSPTTTPIVIVAEPEIQLSATRGGPNTIVDIRGTGFPAQTWVVVRLGISPVNLSQSYAQELTTTAGTFETEMMMPTAWEGADLTGQTELIVVAETADQALRATATFTLQYDGAFQTYEDTETGFALDIPADWVVTEPQTTPLGEMILLGLGEPVSGDPAVSTILVADGTQIRPAEAVNLLQCGTLACQERVSLGITEISGLDARQAIIGTDETPKLEWFFINHNGRLVYFSLHDPTTLQTLEPLIDTFRLIEQEEISVATDTPEPTQTATAEPTATVTEEAEEVTETPTATATATAEPTATATAVPTETNTPEPTNTPVPSSTPTAVPPTETPQPTPTPPDPLKAGPLQTLIHLLEIIIAQNVNTDTIDHFIEAQREETVTTIADVETILDLSFVPSRFDANRIPDISAIVVAVEFPSASGTSETRYFSLLEEDDRWRINQGSEDDPSDTIAPPTITSTAEAEEGTPEASDA